MGYRTAERKGIGAVRQFYENANEFKLWADSGMPALKHCCEQYRHWWNRGWEL